MHLYTNKRGLTSLPIPVNEPKSHDRTPPCLLVFTLTVKIPLCGISASICQLAIRTIPPFSQGAPWQPFGSASCRPV